MLHKLSSVPLVNKSRLIKPARMIPDRLSIRVKPLHDIFQGKASVIGKEKQNCDAVVIRNSLQMALHLLRTFELCCHALIIHNILTFSSLSGCRVWVRFWFCL